MPNNLIVRYLVAPALALGLGFGAAQAETTKVSVALPFPDGVAWPHLSVAKKMGYFAEEGIEPKILSLNGSSASFRALVTGQADLAFTQPAQVLNGMIRGEDTVSVYLAYQKHVYQFARPADSSHDKIADLKGQTIGVSTVAGGQYPYLLATLRNAGLEVGPGKDVQVAEIGRGGAASVALSEGRIAAYSASFVDMLAIRLKGQELKLYQEGPTASFISDVLVAKRDYLDSNRDNVVRFARAVAKGTLFCMENEAACWQLIADEIPDTAKNPDFTRPLLEAVLDLHELPDDANGQWGYQPPVGWEAIHQFLIESDQLEKPVADLGSAFTNQLLPEINDFDSKEVRMAAAKQK